MCALLDELNPETAPHRPYVAFRYAQPLTETALDQMKRDGVTRAVAFTQYPQYSCSTTGSSLNELYKQTGAGKAKMTNWGGNGEVQWSFIDRWPAHPGLVDVSLRLDVSRRSTSMLICQAFAQNIKTALAQYPENRRSDVVLLFSAHSLPLEIVKYVESIFVRDRLG